LFSSCYFNSKERTSGESEEVQPFLKTIERDRAETVRTEITMSAGELQVQGGTRDLVNAKVEYTHEDWKPVISYSTTSNDRGRLVIEQPKGGFKSISFGDDDTNRWDITLNENVRQDLYMKVGAGTTEVNLHGFRLNLFSLEAGVGEYNVDLSDTSVPEVDINAGVGEVNLNLTGKWKNDLRAEINGGIGELSLVLPTDVGVHMEINGGLGSVDAPDFRKE